jgi:two-component system, NtrC family, sensor histidine kinase HydH
MENSKNLHFPVRIWPLLSGVALSVILAWFAVNQYLMAIPVAEENLRGLALSLSATVEAISGKDASSFQPLKDIQTADIAYLSIIDRSGTILFHSNSDLTGEKVTDERFTAVFDKGEVSARRILLGTGEEIYESNSPIHVRGEILDLRLALHTYRADSVIRRARVGMAVSFSLIIATWILGVLLYRAVVQAERHRVEMARREQMARMGEMGAVLAHEIRNPLAGIKGYAQLLQEKLAPGENGSSAELIVAEAVRLEDMVNELLDFSRSDTPPPGPVNLNEVLARSLEIIAPEAESSGVVIESTIDDSLTIAGNRDRLEQLFLNLFRNALQAMDNGGVLRIATQRGETGVNVFISDSGRGIEATNFGRVCEPFFTTKARGTGLGLAICKKITEDYSGSIVLESCPGEGTTVRVTFPQPKRRTLGITSFRSR